MFKLNELCDIPKNRSSNITLQFGEKIRVFKKIKWKIDWIVLLNSRKLQAKLYFKSIQLEIAKVLLRQKLDRLLRSVFQSSQI